MRTLGACGGKRGWGGGGCCRGTSKTSWANGLKSTCSLAFLEQNKERNHLFRYVQKCTDNCYLIPVDNKNSSFIPELTKNRF